MVIFSSWFLLALIGSIGEGNGVSSYKVIFQNSCLDILSLVRYKWSDVDIISGVSGRICVSVS